MVDIDSREAGASANVLEVWEAAILCVKLRCLALLGNGWRMCGLDTVLSFFGQRRGDMYGSLRRLVLSESPLGKPIHAHVRMIWIELRAPVQRGRADERAAQTS